MVIHHSYGNKKMLVLVTYDVNTESGDGKRRLRRVAKICESHGQRVQKSVFECLVDPALWVMFSNKLIKEIDLEVDSLRFYFLGSEWKRKVEHIGAHPSYDPEGLLLI
jgi:CRISPR-associated protein Cas2